MAAHSKGMTIRVFGVIVVAIVGFYVLSDDEPDTPKVPTSVPESYLAKSRRLATNVSYLTLIDSSIEVVPSTVDPFRDYPEKIEPIVEVAPPPSADLEGRFRLDAIALGSGYPMAIVNDTVVTIGESISGAQVVSIAAPGVTLRLDGTLFLLTTEVDLKKDASDSSKSFLAKEPQK